MIRCSQCGSSTLILAGMHDRWAMRCGEGHPWVPVPATIVVIEQGNSDLDAELDSILEHGG